VSRNQGILHGIYFVIKSILRYSIEFVSDRYVLVVSKLCGMSVVHVIGDSHVNVFKGKRPFVSHYIGPVTAHNLNNDNSTTRSMEKLSVIVKNISSKDIIMLVLGEIDCRRHIYHQFQEHKGEYSVSDLIDKTISNYGEALNRIQRPGFTLCVYSIPPASRSVNQRSVFPYTGTPEIRAGIVKEFNSKLEILCKTNNYVFVNVYPLVSDKDGMLSLEYAADDIHLNHKILSQVREQLKKVSSRFNNIVYSC
jgi:hypothetical protein